MSWMRREWICFFPIKIFSNSQPWRQKNRTTSKDCYGGDRAMRSLWYCYSLTIFLNSYFRWRKVFVFTYWREKYSHGWCLERDRTRSTYYTLGGSGRVMESWWGYSCCKLYKCHWCESWDSYFTPWDCYSSLSSKYLFYFWHFFVFGAKIW